MLGSTPTKLIMKAISCWQMSDAAPLSRLQNYLDLLGVLLLLLLLLLLLQAAIAAAAAQKG